jgi:hypothetical protein
MVSWKDILNFDVISAFVKQVTGVEINEELKEKGFNVLRENFSEEEIYEMEATEIEQELIKIYLDILKKKGVHIKPRIRVHSPKGGRIPAGMMDVEQLKKLLEMMGDEDDDDYGSDSDRNIDDLYT